MNIKNLLEHKTIWFILALFWTILIGLLCLVKFDSLKSFNIVSQTDKYVHFIFHFLFTVFWALSSNVKNHLTNQKLVIIVFSSVTYGIALELMQLEFTSTRKADVMDVLSNVIGALSAMIVINYLRLNKNKT